MKSRLAASDALYLKPLLFGLDRSDSPFDLIIDFPANNSLNLSKRSGGIRNAFLSPIDYARHGAEYRIVPKICVASSEPTGTVQLILKSGLKNIERIAVDIRFTSEIILANIILLEKYRNESSHLKHQFIPMTPDIDAMLAKADAALLVQDDPESLGRENTYTLDLVEEWVDLTGLPYVHGFWVGRDGELLPLEIQALLTAKQDGLRLKSQIAQTVALQKKSSLDDLTHYISAFSYDFGEKEEESLAEFMHYAFFHGIIGDVPEIMFFDAGSDTQLQN
jgi:chorismate dehydratase